MDANSRVQSRYPQGTPVGGQFAARSHPEASFSLEPDRPVRKVLPNGTEEWRVHDQFHCTYGPAVIYKDGTEEWWCHDQLHRTDGPAITHPDGTEEWWEHGHRVC